MVPGILRITPATPALPLPPTPEGHLTDLPDPKVHSLENALIEFGKALVVPHPSERCAHVSLPAEQPNSLQSLIFPMAMRTACF